MSNADKEFLKRLRQAFAAEAKEQLQSISGALLTLERDLAQDATQLVELMYRQAHNLKGSARAVNMTHFESICQALEAVFSAMKKEKMQLTSEGIDVLHRSVDVLMKLLDTNETDLDVHNKIIGDLRGRIAQVILGGATERASQPGEPLIAPA